MEQKYEEYSDRELYEMLTKDKAIAEKAFAELYSRFSSMVYAYILRFMGDKDEAKDVFQDTFVKFHQCAWQDRNMTNVPGFLMTIARNLCINEKRNDQKSISYEEYMGEKDDPEEAKEKDELLELVKMAMDLLPDDLKEVFILREYQGYSYHEIADLTNEKLSNVKVRIFRARNKIREILKPYLKEIKKYENN